MKIGINIISFLFVFTCIGCAAHQAAPLSHYSKATQTLDSLHHYYSVNGSKLLRETYPFSTNFDVSYLGDNVDSASRYNQFSFLWPYSGVFSAVKTIYLSKGDEKYKSMLDNDILPGLEMYFDTQRKPAAYSSYITSVRVSDRFYDDNIWLGIDFTELYLKSNDEKYLHKAELIWQFIESGTDSKLGDGIYWKEQRKNSKNTCSNAPGAVFALKMYEATNDVNYLKRGKELYHWTKTNLQDKSDGLYFDNIRLNGKIDSTKYTYNSGQMLQAAALLYKLTKDKSYLSDANLLAEACTKRFFDLTELDFPKLKNGNNWFVAVMLRGFVELYTINNDRKYIDNFDKSMDYVWNHLRGENGLFDDTVLSKKIKPKNTKWLLTQAGMIEIYANLSLIPY